MAGMNKMRQRTFYATDKLRNLSKRQRDLVRALRESGEEEYTVEGYVTQEDIENAGDYSGYYRRKRMEAEQYEETDREYNEAAEDEAADMYENYLDAIESMISELKMDDDGRVAQLGDWLDGKWSSLIKKIGEPQTREMLNQNGEDILACFDRMNDVGYVGDKVHALWTEVEDLMHYIPVASTDGMNEVMSSAGEYLTSNNY